MVEAEEEEEGGSPSEWRFSEVALRRRAIRKYMSEVYFRVGSSGLEVNEGEKDEWGGER